MVDEKKKVEAILFSVGKRMSVEEIAKLCKIRNRKKVLEVLKELQSGYNKKHGAMKIINEGEDIWKMAVKDEHIPIIQNIVTDTELSKTVMETLAVIAWKYPILQADVIKIRTNKAYDHMKELEEAGFIRRERFGRTKKVFLTDKFFQYFDLPPDRQNTHEIFRMKVPEHIKQKVMEEEGRIDEAEKTMGKINEKNKETEERLRKHKEEEEKRKAEMEGQAKVEPYEDVEVDLVDDFGHKEKLAEYDVAPPGPEKKGRFGRKKVGEAAAEETPDGEEEVTEEEPEKESPEVEAAMNKMLNPKEEKEKKEEPVEEAPTEEKEPEPKQEQPAEEKETEEEPKDLIEAAAEEKNVSS